MRIYLYKNTLEKLISSYFRERVVKCDDHTLMTLAIDFFFFMIKKIAAPFFRLRLLGVLPDGMKRLRGFVVKNEINLKLLLFGEKTAVAYTKNYTIKTYDNYAKKKMRRITLPLHIMPYYYFFLSIDTIFNIGDL